jgi:valyl-tRNA synthetase
MTTPPAALDQLPATYDAAGTEPALTARWLADGLFSPTPAGPDAPPFTIVMPPPNVTAVLHVGHGLNNTVQDVLVRWRRMAGDDVLWMPGTDHAGIATQNVVEKLVAKEGQTRFDVGREAFVARVADFVDTTGGVILDQLKAIGASADWTRTAYTLSPSLSVAVREAFVRLHEQGLVYRGHRVIHWCPRCGTSLSDEEAEFQDTEGSLYHLRYPLADDPEQGITVATTRPETLLGDVAVAVHPDDARYRAVVGRELKLPIANVRIPVVADAYTDPAFGSGAVKITPAHDANDFEVARRHALAMPVVIDAEGRLGDVDPAGGPPRVPAELVGVDRFEARAQLVARLREAGVLVRQEPHQHAVRHCYRCGTVVEPRLSRQWFVRMRPLAERALAALHDGQLRILPERWEAVYVQWLEGIRDWNISRQLWWGHRIPAWYDDATGEVFVSREDLTHSPTTGHPLRQDEDVLDTWFSSWLWPISTMGWPDEQAPDLKRFYPGDVLVSAPEILFFWVARMVMSGCWFMGRPPFHTVYLHGTVRDMQHRKMSKSLGNGIDPLDVVRLYGADALRWTLIAGLGLGADVMLDPADLERSFGPGRNFCTKLWNIGRFLLARVGTEPVRPVSALDPAALTAADRWILDRLDQAIAESEAALGPARPGADGRWTARERGEGLRLMEYAATARRFVWDELADWYLESVKPRLAAEGEDREVARAVLVHAFDGALRLLHPIVPFITDTLWQRLPGVAAGATLPTARWPVARATPLPGGAAFETARAAVEAVRSVRAEYKVAPGAPLDVTFVPATGLRDAIGSIEPVLATLGRVRVQVADVAPGGAVAAAVLADGSQLVIPLAGMIDLDKERAKLDGELAGLDRQVEGLASRLANPGFTGKAPAHVVEAERQRLAELEERRRTLGARRTALGD